MAELLEASRESTQSGSFLFLPKRLASTVISASRATTAAFAGTGGVEAQLRADAGRPGRLERFCQACRLRAVAMSGLAENLTIQLVGPHVLAALVRVHR